MAYSPFKSTTSKTKKNNDDDLFSAAKKLAYNDVYGNKKEQTSSTTYQSKVAAPTMPTVSSTVGNHTSSYGQYAADKSARKQEIESRLGQIQNEMTTVSSVLSGYSPTRQNSNAYVLAKNKAYELTKERSELERELQALSKTEAEPTAEYRDATLKDITLNSIRQGFYNSEYGKESYKDMMGWDSEKQKYEDILAGEDYQFTPGNAFEEAISGAATLFGQQINQWSDPRSLGAAGAGVATALALGNATPLAVLPEEVITVPGAAIAGIKTGSTISNFEIEAGLAYNEMLENGVSPETAKKVALGVGGANAALEMLQLDELTKSFKILKNNPATEAAADSLGKRLLDMGIDITKSVGKETAQEVAQEGVTIHGVQKATEKDTGEKAYTGEEVAGRLLDTAKSSALSFGVMNVPHATVGTYNAVRADRTGSTYNTDINALVEEGLQSDPNSESYKMASKLKARLDNGGTVSNTEAYDLAVANQAEINRETKRANFEAQQETVDNSSPVVESSVETAPVQSRVATIQSRLAESGMETAQAEAAATSIDRILSGDTSITNKDKNVLSVGNKEARAIFEEETGVKLPASNSSTRQAISEYVAQTALKQQKQETATDTNVDDKPVENVMTAWQNQKAQEEKVNQLKSAVPTFTPSANSAEATLRQAAEVAVARGKINEAVTVQTNMTTLGNNGQRVYQKHLSNAKSVTSYSNAFQRYYDAGQIGLPFEQIKTAYDGAVDRSILYEAYSAGQNDASLDGKGKPTIKKKNAQKGKKTPSKGKGRFYDSRTSAGKSVDEKTTKALEQFAKVFNIDIELVDSIDVKGHKSAANGYYDRGSNKVYLAADSDNPLLVVLKHEVTHYLQRNAPEQYKAFKDYVMKAFYGNSQEAMNFEIQRRIDEAARKNVKLSRAAAMDEIVADATETFLTDRDSIDALAKENRSLAETILNAIRDVLHKIEAAMRGVKVSDYHKFWNEDQLKAAEKMWVEALADAANTEIGVNDVTISESSAPVWSLKSMKFDLMDGQMQRDLVEHGIMTLEESQNLMNNISKLIDDMSPFAHIVDMNEEYSKGNRPFAVYKPNSDPLYKVSLDFSTLCKKRLMTQFVMESLQTKLGKALSAKEQMAIRSKLEEYGKVNEQIQVACALCYVEARRLKAPDQINRFLDDRTTILTDYFGKKNKAYKQKVDDMADRMKVEMGYKADTKLKDMKSGDKKKVNEAKQKMMKEYTPTAEEQKIISRANAIDNAEFLSQDGLTRLNLNEPVIYDAFVSHVRNATKSKALEGGVPYYYGDSKSVSDSLIEAMNAENGLRHQSWSDFEIIHLLDTIAAVIDLSVRKAKVQSYTKVPAFVHVNGNTGMMINLSLIPAGKNGMKDGKLDFSPVEGMDYAVAVELRDQYHKTTGTIAIGIDDTQIDMLLNDETIDYVIPYHTSGMNAQLRKMAGIAGWMDYESFQSEKEIKGAKQGDCPDELWHKKPDFSEWFDTSKLDMSKSGVEIMREAAGRYLVMCEERGLRPKFSDSKKHTDFSKHENYWKLLIDRKMVDGDGNIIIQQAVRPNFDFDKISEVVNAEVKAYDPTLLDSINEKIMSEWESGGIKQREAELLKDEKAKKKAAKVANGLVEQVVKPAKAKKITTDDGDGQYMLKGGKYDYDTLVAKPDMKLTEVDDTVQYNTDSKAKKGIVNEAKKNAAIIGRTNENGGVEVYVDDIGVSVVLSTDGLRHGLDRRTQLLAPVTVNAGEILKHSVRINELLPRKETISNTYALLGSARGKSGNLYIVEFVVNRYDNTIASMDVLYSVNTKKESAALNAPRLTVNPLSVTDSKISIAQLLDIARDNFPDILPESVLRHFGFDSRPEGELGESALYQLKTPDEMLEVTKQIAAEEHKAKAVTNAEIMSQAVKDIAKTDAEKKTVSDYQRAIKSLADYEKKLAVYEATKAEHDKHRSIYTDASGKVKKSGVKYSAAEKAEIQQKINWWKKRLDDIEKRDEFKKILKREKAKMAETHAKKMSDLRDAYGKRMDALRAQRDAKVEAEKQKMRDYKQNQRDTKEYKALKAKLESDVKWLSERLVHPTDAKHIPEEFKKGVAAFLESLDFETEYTDSYTVRNGKPSHKVIKLRELRESYENILKDQSSELELDETQLAALKELEKICDNKRVADLDYAELGLVRDAIEYIKMSVAVADKAFNTKIKETISAMGEALIQEQRSKKARKDRAGILGEADKLINYDNVAPADKFHEFGGVMEKMYHEIRKGFDKHISNVQSAISYTQNLIKGKEDAIKEWSGKKATTTKFQISDGTTIELTPAQVMSLYCLMKRDQAVGHILGSGIVPSDLEVEGSKKIGKVNLPATKKLYSERASRCTIEDIQKIVDTLTADQKKIADGVMKLFTTKCADWGNETSMTLYGYKKFNEANYFPIKSSDAYLNARFDDSGDVLIKNLGFTKNTVVNANNPIVVDDIFNVLADHVNKMSMYNALVVPLTDFTRVFNYKSKGINQDGESVINDSVQKALEASGGSLGIQYIKQFMKDVNKQANSLAAESFINKSISRYKKAKIAASARVLLQQPTAITRAAAMVDPKYLIKGLQQKANYEEMFNHSEIAYWKSLGFYQTDMGRNMKDILLDNETALDSLTMGMYGKADDFAWGHLWNAIKLEQADAHPDMDKTSSEFMDLVADRFDEVVDRTQVVDSVFHRSQIMRAQGAATKVATAFMAEPTKAFNLLRTDLIDSLNSKDYSKFKRSAVTYVANAILVSAFAGIADMIRDDEDEDDEGNKRNLWDKYRDATAKNVVNNINPLGMIPYFKELSSMLQGYDVSRMEMASLSEFVKTARKWTQGKYSYPYLIKETAEDISELFGIPLKNAIRDVTALVRTAGDMVGGHYYADYMVDKMKYNIANSNNRSIFYKHYTDALMAGDEAAAEAILADMVVNGIPYDNIVSKGYQKEKEVAFSEARKLIAAGKTDEAKKIIRELSKQYDKKFSTLWKSVRDGDSADEPEETYDFKDLQTAIRKGEDTELIEDYLTEYGGYSEEALEEAVKLLTEKYQ